MKRIFALLAVGAFVLALPASHLVFGKGHVPAHKAQVCHDGEVLEVGKAALKAHLSLHEGDAEVPSNDFTCIYFKGDACDSDSLCPHSP